MRIEELIGGRIRTERERAGLTQEQLAELLVERLGKTGWNRQQVSLAERGGRALIAVELLAFADALTVPLVSLLVPPAGLLHVEIPGTTYRVDVHRVLLGIPAETDGQDLSAVLAEALGHLAALAKLHNEAGEAASMAHGALAAAARQRTKGTT